jgi:hypothetical protein
LRALPSQTIASPRRLSHRGVAGPFRVFSGEEVAGLSGYLLPVRCRHSPSAPPFRSSCLHPCPGTRLPGRSSHGVQLSFTASRMLHPRPLGRRHLSWGFVPLQRSREEESTSVRFPGSAASALPRFSTGRSHPAGYGVALRFSQPLGDLVPLPTVPPCFRRVALLGLCPSGVRSCFAAPATRRRRRPLLTFLPSARPCPHPRWGPPWARRTLPRMVRPVAFSRLQGLCPRNSRSASSTRVKASMTDLPLLGFHLLMV